MTGKQRPPGSSRAPLRSGLKAVRQAYADRLMEMAGATDPRLRKAFATIGREDYLPPPPWKIITGGAFLATTSDDPSDLYRNVLVSLVPEKHINNGEPSLHLAWLAAVDPRPGETACHVGAGTGYYTAILAELVKPGGRVNAYEIEPGLAAQATINLAARRHVAVHACDATFYPLAACDIIYVSAGISVPPVQWLDALKPGGRLIFPWRPAQDVALAMLTTRVASGFAVKPLMGVWFIPLTGIAGQEKALKLADRKSAPTIRSAFRTADAAPDESAVAIYEKVWFSSRELGCTG